MSTDTLVFELLSQWCDVPAGGLQPSHRLVADLHIDGDDYGMSLVPAIKKRLGIQSSRQEWERVVTVADLLAVVHSHCPPDAMPGQPSN
jgi:acyl carrier protein